MTGRSLWGLVLKLAVFLSACCCLQDSYRDRPPPRSSTSVLAESSRSVLHLTGRIHDRTLFHGSAFLVGMDDDHTHTYALTASHLCQVSSKTENLWFFSSQDFYLQAETSRGTIRFFEIVRTSSSHDLCLIRTKGRVWLPAVELAESRPSAAEPVFSVSSDLGIYKQGSAIVHEGRYAGKNFQISHIPGVSMEEVDIYSMSSTVGASGSPVINRAGKATGMVSISIGPNGDLTGSPPLDEMKSFLSESLPDE